MAMDRRRTPAVVSALLALAAVVPTAGQAPQGRIKAATDRSWC